jgi:putative membrane protein
MQSKADLRDYLAVERTFLAWIRTGLALMGFGFVVARFGLFLQQIQLLNRTASPQPTGLSLWFGTALIAAGILVHLGSAWRHVRLVRQLDQGDTGSSRSLAYAVATAVFLAAVGLAMAIYLLSVRESAKATNTPITWQITTPADSGRNEERNYCKA